ncbi:Protein of unknown function [Desulfonispora thiosulfatigenes DSM 11270]|uniref:Lipopolysaccharide assembly protein A domain-containing protein n=1 Tax=Desulfonispora thiosulfatigenes DSM 11270 TaxID=656914 RepID=A0A1W1UJ33_DESTI|nr:LapA family protein [Desulfonispora thiosulfatigenes]SMB81087.1 Protein of unknown function [Desulfonispora thiosulfatigenes DSM 11270]
MDWKFSLSLLFAVLVALFAIQNSGTVEINFLFVNFSASQALIILISAAFGAVIALLLSLVKQYQQSRKLKECKQEKEILEKDKKQLEQELELKNQNLLNESENCLEESVDTTELDE